ncbi:MAG: hypothetical protein DCF22_12685 [Leptolyngbya sp.]|nr:MAG: hypothetical protein DCF22_12685 [Leptolyngbya sp.]
MAIIVQGIKSFIERLLSLGAKIPLATVRRFAMVMGVGMTTEPTFHRSCLEGKVSLPYSTHQNLTHYHALRVSFAKQLLQNDQPVAKRGITRSPKGRDMGNSAMILTLVLSPYPFLP